MDILSQDFPDLQKTAIPDYHVSEFSAQADEGTANLMCPLVENDGEVETKDALSPSPPMSRIGVNTHKAGMEGLDKKKINQIILEASKGSSYYENELKKEQKVSERIAKLRKDLKRFTAMEIQKAKQEADKEVTQLESERDLSNIIVHVDMDAFYAAVEMRDEPKLKSVPMAVGGNSMLSTSNYLARRYGVRAGMPGFIGRKLCPELVIVGLNFDKYRHVSEQVRKILAEYDPKLSPVGLDECYLNLTQYVTREMITQQQQQQPTGSSTVDRSDEQAASAAGTSPVAHARALTITDNFTEPVHYEECHLDRHQYPLPHDEGAFTVTENMKDCIEEYELDSLSLAHWRCAEEVVQEIRSKIEQCTGLTASAGIAHNRMLSKVASDLNKPNGQFTVPFNKDTLFQFVRGLSIRKITGIGKVTEKLLNALGISTCQNLYDQRGILHLLFSRTSSRHFLRISLGIGSADVSSEWERKSISTERTFSEISSPDQLMQKCHDLCSCLAEDVAQERLKGKTVTLKLKMVTFMVRQRSTTLSHPISQFNEIYQAASTLLAAEMSACSPSPLRIRLMGVRLSSLSSAESSPSKRNSTLDTYFQTGTAKKLKMEPEKNVTSQTATESTLPDQLDKEECQCPVCGQLVRGDNMILNKHVDECLNQGLLLTAMATERCDSQKDEEAAINRETHKGVRVGNQKKSSITNKRQTINNFFKTV